LGVGFFDDNQRPVGDPLLDDAGDALAVVLGLDVEDAATAKPTHSGDLGSARHSPFAMAFWAAIRCDVETPSNSSGHFHGHATPT
jgi:hypothetical protein